MNNFLTTSLCLFVLLPKSCLKCTESYDFCEIWETTNCRNARIQNVSTPCNQNNTAIIKPRMNILKWKEFPVTTDCCNATEMKNIFSQYDVIRLITRLFVLTTHWFRTVVLINNCLLLLLLCVLQSVTTLTCEKTEFYLIHFA